MSVVEHPGHLSAQQLADYHTHGFILLPGVLSRAQARALRVEGHAVIERLVERHDVEATWDSAAAAVPHQPMASQTSLQHCHDVQYHSAAFTRLLLDERMIGPASELMQTPNVQLHHNKLFVKPPANGSPFPMHQDWPFFPHQNDSVTAMIVHLDDAPVERGCVRVVPGSHRGGRREHEGERHWYLPADRFPLDQATPVPAKAGDVLFFSCLMVHGSGVNVSDTPRTTWLLQLRDAADRPTVDRHRSPGQGTMLCGVNDVNVPPPTVL